MSAASERVTLPELTRRVEVVEDDIKEFPKTYASKEALRAVEKVLYLFIGAMLTGLFGLLVAVASKGIR